MHLSITKVSGFPKKNAPAELEAFVFHKVKKACQGSLHYTRQTKALATIYLPKDA
jgi:hypothetical protein